MSERPLHERIDVGGMMMPSWRDVGKRDELLTDDEREAMALTGKLATLCRRIIGDGPIAEQDWNEMATRITHPSFAYLGARWVRRRRPEPPNRFALYEWIDTRSARATSAVRALLQGDET